MEKSTSAAALGDIDGSIESSGTFTDVCYRQLRTLANVEQLPLCLKHTFPSKEIAMMHIAKEANLFGIRIQIRRSDHF